MRTLEAGQEHAGAPPSRPSRAALLAALFRLRALLALVALAAALSFLSPAFLTAANLAILLKHVAINAIMAVGMTFVILSRGIDLSVGSIAGLAGMIAGGLIDRGLMLPMFGVVVYFQVWLVVVIAVLAGALVGAINGLLVARLSVAPFIATLGTMYAARGAALVVGQGPRCGGLRTPARGSRVAGTASKVLGPADPGAHQRADLPADGHTGIGHLASARDTPPVVAASRSGCRRRCIPRSLSDPLPARRGNRTGLQRGCAAFRFGQSAEQPGTAPPDWDGIPPLRRQDRARCSVP